jgi:iron(III) transport system substrate-binding protein
MTGGPSGGTAARVLVALAFLAVLGVPFAARRWTAQTEGGLPPYVPPPGLPARKLVLISPHSDSIRREFEWGFNQYTAEERGFRTQFEWRDVGGTLDAIRYVLDEFERKPQGIGIDLFFGGGVDPYMELGPKGLLQPCEVSPEVIDAIPQEHGGLEVYAADRSWFGACLASFGLLYNIKALELIGLPQPKEWADLGRPEYATWVSSADPSHSGTMHMVYEIILQAYGWEKGWATCMRIGANVREFARSASDVPREVSSAEAAVGVAIDFYGRQAVIEAGEDRMALHIPLALTVTNPDGIGMLKGAPDLELAQMFVEFVLSERGQKLWVLKPGTPGGPRQFALGRLPVIPGFARRFGSDATVESDPFESRGGVAFDAEKKNARWRIFNDLFSARIIGVHTELVAAWRRLKDLPEDDPLKAQLLAPPISEEGMLALAAGEWDDPKVRADTIAEWSGQAKRSYRALASRAR